MTIYCWGTWAKLPVPPLHLPWCHPCSHQSCNTHFTHQSQKLFTCRTYMQATVSHQSRILSVDAREHWLKMLQHIVMSWLKFFKTYKTINGNDHALQSTISFHINIIEAPINFKFMQQLPKAVSENFNHKKICYPSYSTKILDILYLSLHSVDYV